MAIKKWSDNITTSALQGNYDGYIQSSLLQLRLSGPISDSATNGIAVYNIKELTKYKVRLMMDTRFRVAACSSIAMNTVMSNYYRDEADTNGTTSVAAYKETEITSQAGQVYMPVFYWASGSGKSWSEVYSTLEVREELTGRLELTTPPSKTQYTVGEELDLTGMAVSVVWSDGTKERVTEYTVSGYDGTVAGSCTVTVAYQGETVSFQVTVAQKTVTSIAVTTIPSKTCYVRGEALDLTGMVVTATYSDGSTAEVFDYTLSGYDANNFEAQWITVTYEEKKATFTVKVYRYTSTTLPSILNTTTGMSVVRNTVNTTSTPDYIALLYVDDYRYPYWFTNGWLSRIYIDKAGAISFESHRDTSTKLQVFSLFGLASVKTIHKQEGVLENGRDFIKIRVSGSRSSTSSNYTPDVTYEFFFFGDTGNDPSTYQMMLNFVTIPSDASIYSSGLCYVTLSGQNVILPLVYGKKDQVWLESIGSDRMSWTIDTSKATLNDLLGNYAYMSNKSTYTNRTPWFKIGNKILSNISISNTTYVSLNSTLNQIAPWYDGDKSNSVSRYGTYMNSPLKLDGIDVFKVRANVNLASYSPTDTRMYYEVFFFSTQKILVNIVLTPTNEKYVGQHYVDLGGSKIDLDLDFGQEDKKIWIYLNDAGTIYAIKYGEDSTVSKLQLATQPINNTVYQGSTPDFSGLSLNATFKDGNTSTLSTFDMNDISYTDEVGAQTATVRFREGTTSFPIHVLEDSIGSISLTISRDHYLIGDVLGIITVTATRLSGKTEVISSGYSVAGYDMEVAGEQTVTVAYEGFSTSKMIYVYDASSSSLVINTENAKTDYLVGIDGFETWDFSGTLTYGDGTTESISSEDIEFLGFDNSTIGTVEITAAYKILSDSFSINITDEIIEEVGALDQADMLAKLNVVTGIVTISGNGEMKSFNSGWGEYILFSNYRDYIKEVIVDEGVGILSNAFFGCQNLMKVTLPESLTKILYTENGDECFTRCQKLSEINIPTSLTTINGFAMCIGLTEMELPENVSEIGPQCFTGCLNLALTIRNAQCSIYESEYDSDPTIQVKKLIGHLGSTAETYAVKYRIPFEALEKVTGLIVKRWPDRTFHTGEELDKRELEVAFILDTGEAMVTDIYSLDYDFSKPGDAIITVSYNELSQSFTVRVVAFQFSDIIGTALYMKAERDNVKNDDGTDALNGVDWFKFNGTIVSSIYISGNNWVGLGASTEQLKICRRDGAVYYVYRMEGMLINGVRFFKIRVEGYTYYSGTDLARQLIYELFLFDNKDMFLNIIASPTDSSYVGSSSIVCNGEETSLDIPVNATSNGPYGISFMHKDNNGLKWDILYEGYNFSTAIEITIMTLPDKIEYIVGDEANMAGLSVSVKFDNGAVEPVTDYVLSGFDSSSGGVKTITVAYEGLTATFEVKVYGAIQGIRIAHYPNKVYYKIGETLDVTGLEVVNLTEGGLERRVTDYTLSDLDSSKVGNKQITVSYEVEVDAETTAVYLAHFSVKVTATGDNPFEDTKQPITVTVHWINGEFKDLGNDDLTGAVVLQESICSANYFVFGGCISNMVKFTTHSPQFMGTAEKDAPHGDIEVYVERKGTRVKIFTGTIDSGKRTAGLTAREIIAYDYLYHNRNTDIVWWLRNKTTDKQMVLTQLQFRRQLFGFLGIEEVPTKLYYDDAYVPNTNQTNSIIVADVLKDMCLQNSVFGWVNRDGQFEYLRLPENSRRKSHDNAGNVTYEYFPAEIYVDTYESCEFDEGRIWYPNEFYSDPDPRYGFSDRPPQSAQESYERNVYYNRNSFFIGNADWLDSAWQVDEYGSATVQEPIFPIFFGPIVDMFRLYRAQGYRLTLPGNPLNKVGDTIEITVRKTADDGTQLEWVIHSYIMSRTLTILADGSMTDVYTARNAPYNGNTAQAGHNTMEIAAQVFQLRANGPVISYADFSDGTSTLAVDATLKKDRLRCVKRMSQEEYDAMEKAGATRTDTLYFTYS